MPPARVEIGSRTVVHSSGMAGDPAANAASGLVRAGIHPLQVTALAERTPWDVGVGYEAESLGSHAQSAVHGPYLEFGAYPLSAPLGNLRARWGGYTSVDLLLHSPSGANERGFGITLGTLLEITGKASGAFEAPGVAGGAYGQWALGAFLSGGTREFEDSSYRAVSVGVSLRIPFAAGIVCCAIPHSGDSESSSESQSSESSSGSSSVGRLDRAQPERHRDAPSRSYVPAKPKKAE